MAAWKCMRDVQWYVQSHWLCSGGVTPKIVKICDWKDYQFWGTNGHYCPQLYKTIVHNGRPRWRAIPSPAQQSHQLPPKPQDRDNIPHEAIKFGKPALLWPLSVICLCPEEEAILQDMPHTTTVTLSRTRAIAVTAMITEGSLLSFFFFLKSAGLYPPELPIYILAGHAHPESQYNYRAELLTMDFISSIHQLQDKRRDQGQLLYIALLEKCRLISSSTANIYLQVIHIQNSSAILRQKY